jgi:hypothetical protein
LKRHEGLGAGARLRLKVEAVCLSPKCARDFDY